MLGQAAFDWRIAAWMTPPSVAAAFLGGYSGGRVPETLLLGGIAAALLWNGVPLLFELGAPSRARSPGLAAAVAGAVIGLIGGAVGACVWRSTGRCSPSVWPPLFREPGSAPG